MKPLTHMAEKRLERLSLRIHLKRPQLTNNSRSVIYTSHLQVPGPRAS
jgi:hypothetical protein